MARKAHLAALVLFAASVASWGWAQTPLAQGEEPLPRIDVSEASASAAAFVEPSISASQLAAADSLRGLTPGLDIQWNVLTGTPRKIQSRDALLTDPSPGASPTAIVRQYLEQNSGVYGLDGGDLNTLVPVRSSEAQGSPSIAAVQRTGLRHVALEQRWQDRQIFPAVLVGSLTSRGELASLSGNVVREVGDKVNAIEPILTPIDAIAAASRSLGAAFEASEHQAVNDATGAERRQLFSGGNTFDADVPVRLIYFVASSDEIRLVWEVIAGVREDPFVYQVLVDALTGDVQFRTTITSQEAPMWLAYFNVIKNPPIHPKTDYQPLDNPAPLSPGPTAPNGSQGATVTPVLFAANGDPSVSPGGWIADGIQMPTGNNVIAFVDRNFNSRADAGEQPNATTVTIDGVPTRTFEFPANHASEPTTPGNEAAATVNTFVVANWWHDRMEMLGFDELAGNFQAENGEAGGVGGDPMLARLHVGENNSTFSTPPADGTCCPRLNAYTWTGPTPDRDSGFDQEILIHEFTHGLSNRVIGGPNVNGLEGDGQPRGLGEGYSDIYALLLLRAPDEDPDGIYVVGSFSVLNLSFTGQPPNWQENYSFGIRHFPYTTDLCRNPQTLADMQAATYDITPIPQAVCSGTPPVSPWLATLAGRPHDMGEIWASMVWEVRRKLVEKHGVEVGNELALQLVTDSLFLLPRNPTFIEARDAILIADLARTSNANRCEIWRGFAKRGIGAGAATPVTGAFIEDFNLPGDCAEAPVSALTNNN